MVLKNHDIILNLNILFTPKAGFIIASPPWPDGRELINNSSIPDLFASLVFIKHCELNQMRQRDSENTLDELKTLAKNTNSLSEFEKYDVEARKRNWNCASHQTSINDYVKSGYEIEIQEITNVLISHSARRGAELSTPSADFEFAKHNLFYTNTSESENAATVSEARRELPR